MSKKRTRVSDTRTTGDRTRTTTGRPRTSQHPAWRTWWIAGAIGAMAVVIVTLVVLVGLGQPGVKPAPIAATAAGWTNITPDRLATMLQSKDFTLLNVKTPYMGEIAGTDLYIPYDQLSYRSAELPSDKQTKIVVYCRSGNESAVAAQTLLNLGYRNIENLDGGMTAWVATGRQLIQVNRAGS